MDTWRAYTKDNRKAMNLGDPKDGSAKTVYGDEQLDVEKCEFWRGLGLFGGKSEEGFGRNRFVVQELK